MSLALNNKVLTWDSLQKRNKYSSPGRCPLCKASIENISHLLITCPYTTQVWKDLESSAGFNDAWSRTSCLRLPQEWDVNVAVKIQALLLIVALGIWLSRNTSLFEDRYNVPCRAHSL